MIHFLICDTDPVLLDEIACLLHQYFNPCQVEYAYGPDSLEIALRSSTSNAAVLITEIELYDSNAIQIIQRSLSDSSLTQVLYMTQKVDYCTEVYETRHCGFLRKPLDKKRMLRDIRRAIQMYEQQQMKGIVVAQGGVLHVVFPPQLQYVESHGRILTIVTDCERLSTYDKLDHFAEKLDARFVQCHQSYLVNMECVKKLCSNTFIMRNGDCVPISQSRRKEVKQNFMNYMKA